MDRSILPRAVDIDQPGPVVAGEDDDRVVADPRFIHAVHDLPEPVVHLGHEVRVHSEPRGIGLIEIGVHLRRRVQVREPDIGEERLVALGGPLDVIGGLPDDQFVQEGTHLQVQLAHRRGLLALLAFPDFGRLDSLRPDQLPERRVRRIAGLIDAVLVAPPLVEALVGRQPALDLAEMPLTPQRCRVTRVREQLGDRVLPGRQAALAFPRVWHLERSGSHRLAAGQDRGAGRRALRLDRVVGEADALAGELVDAGSRGAAPVAREVAPAGVIAQDENDVRPGWLTHDVPLSPLARLCVLRL